MLVRFQQMELLHGPAWNVEIPLKNNDNSLTMFSALATILGGMHGILQ